MEQKGPGVSVLFVKESPAPEPYPGTICPGSVNSPLLSVDEGKGFLITANFQVFPNFCSPNKEKSPSTKGSRCVDTRGMRELGWKRIAFIGNCMINQLQVADDVGPPLLVEQQRKGTIA
ncbi:hypothetical protein CDAR_289891 [Caerostris darwini]|uniref:Uncharacterized protein n=1 Tax=Caerostris darwini TaxID=1538125 RepID=A0AAV4WZA8_9ARAC|nr:hypothetical protein CDAR_289891 [Caerostris darwini]